MFSSQEVGWPVQLRRFFGGVELGVGRLEVDGLTGGRWGIEGRQQRSSAAGAGVPLGHRPYDTVPGRKTQRRGRRNLDLRRGRQTEADARGRRRHAMHRWPRHEPASHTGPVHLATVHVGRHGREAGAPGPKSSEANFVKGRFQHVGKAQHSLLFLRFRTQLSIPRLNAFFLHWKGSRHLEWNITIIIIGWNSLTGYKNFYLLDFVISLQMILGDKTFKKDHCNFGISGECHKAKSLMWFFGGKTLCRFGLAAD